MSDHYVGIDWGGTKIEAAVLDHAGRELFRERLPTPKGDYAGCITTACELVERAEAEFGSLPVGVGIPGSISPLTGRVQNANSDWLNGKPLLEDLQTALQRELKMENDANCLALSEAHDGAGKQHATLFAVIIGTGCGAGLVIDGKLRSGPHHIAGEWGHNPLPGLGADDEPAVDCWCGISGCLETYVSGSGLERQYRLRSGRESTAETVIEALRRGEPAAVDTFERYLDQLARGLASIVNVVDPDLIVLGGGMSNVTEIYQQLPQRILPQIFCDQFRTPIVPALHGDSSGVRGAARLNIG